PQKEDLLLPLFNELTEHHRERCAGYSRLLSVIYDWNSGARSMREIPFVPVGLFKTHLLASVPPEAVFKTVTSSGTTGQQVSRIPLDRETAQLQTTALSRIMMHVLGPRRLPMIL